MMFGQLSNRVSLRDLIVALDAHRSKCYHLGIGKQVTKPTLARANQFRKKKGGVKTHVLYDVEAQVPKFFHITNASVHDSKVIKEIPIESGSYYIFDRVYNNFKEMYRIHQAGGYFVVRAKNNLQFQTVLWKRRLPINLRSDSIICLTVYKSAKDYPLTLRRLVYWDDEQKREFVFLSNNSDLLRHHYLLSGCHCPEGHETRKKHL